MPFLKGGTALVTGGAGLIGSHIVDLLVAEELGEVRVLDRFTDAQGYLADAAGNGAQQTGVTIIDGDIRDRRILEKAARSCDFVFHQAVAPLEAFVERPRDCVEILIEGTFNVFEAALAAGVKKVVYASTASAGYVEGTSPAVEANIPHGVYAAAKLMNEKVARYFHETHGLCSVGLRYCDIYGPGMEPTGSIADHIRRWFDCIERNVPPLIRNDPSSKVELMYVGEVARANVQAMASDVANGVYSLGSGGAIPLSELWTAVQEVTGSQLEPNYRKSHKRRRGAPRATYVADTQSAREDFGFDAEVPLRKGLAMLAEWHRGAVKSAAKRT